VGCSVRGRGCRARPCEDTTFETEVCELGQGLAVDNETLAPSMKLKRSQTTKKCQKARDDMYAALNCECAAWSTENHDGEWESLSCE
jgi:hypothetical protein